VSSQLTAGDKIEGDAMEGQDELAIRIIKADSFKPKSKKKAAKKTAPETGSDDVEEAPEAPENTNDDDKG